MGPHPHGGSAPSLAAEYALNWALDRFVKPTVSLIDGMVMGGGVGISLYGTHRVAGERYRFAMPETGIGLFPDDGVSLCFARMPDEIGMYLALTGRRSAAADAYRLGLVTHCIPGREFAEIRAAVGRPIPSIPCSTRGTRSRAPGNSTPCGRPSRGASRPKASRPSCEACGRDGSSAAWAEGVLAGADATLAASLK